MAHEGRFNLLRSTSEEARVEPAELFFDLVFVFAITQLSHRLITHPDPRGFLETGLLLLAVWWVWINTAWVTNWLDPSRTRVRLLLFAMMGGGLVVSTSIPQAFDARGGLFAAAYVAMELGRSLFMIIANRRHERDNAMNFVRILIWQLAAAAFWIAGGLSAGDMACGCGRRRSRSGRSRRSFTCTCRARRFAHRNLARSIPHHLAERCGRLSS